MNGTTRVAGTTNNVTFAGNTFNGQLILSDNNQVSANEQFGDYGPILVGNTLVGGLACEGNSAKPNDFGAPNVIKGKSTGPCTDLTVSASRLKPLVEHFAEEKQIKGDDVARALRTHLVALDRFEKQGAAEKVVKHAQSLLELLDQKK